VSTSHSHEDRGKNLPSVVHCQELSGSGFVYGDKGGQRSVSHLRCQILLSHLQPSRSEVLSSSDHHHVSISLPISRVQTIRTELTSPKHIDDQPNLAPLTRCEIVVIRLDGRSVCEQEVVADDQGLGSRVALWRDGPVGRPPGGVFADSVAEEGIDVGFCIGAVEVGDHAGGDEWSDARSISIGVAGAGLAVDREPILDEVAEFPITDPSVVLKVWDDVRGQETEVLVLQHLWKVPVEQGLRDDQD
jgi:hypothetical protein